MTTPSLKITISDGSRKVVQASASSGAGNQRPAETSTVQYRPGGYSSSSSENSYYSVSIECRSGEPVNFLAAPAPCFLSGSGSLFF